MEPPTPTRPEIADFLNQFKGALTLWDPKWIHREDPAKAHLSGLGITVNQAIKRLRELTPDNYSEGPTPDHRDPSLSVWTFGKDVDGVEAFIKLVIEPDARKRTVSYPAIWSFHSAHHPVQYPLRD